MKGQIEFSYGIHTVRHILASATTDVLELWVQENKKSAKPIAELIAMAGSSQLAVQLVAKKTLDKLTHYINHQGVVVRRKVARVDSQVTLESLLTADNLQQTAFFLVLDGIQDPHNLGACLRTADAAGVQAVILPKDRVVNLNETVRKVASGAAEHVPVIQVTNLARCLKAMRQAGVWIIGTDDEAEEMIYKTELSLPMALVMGSEARGLRQNTRKHCDKLVGIPMLGTVESLNVSVATGVCLYEVQRQCGFNKR